MKKILTILICIILLCSLPVVAFAEEVETPVEAPAETEVPEVETEIPETEAPETEIPETETSVEDDPNDLTVEKIMAFIDSNYDKISVVFTTLFAIFYGMKKSGVINNAITTLNNNSVAIADNSETAIKEALATMESFKQYVEEYKTATEQRVEEMTNHLKASKLANVELANEVAELLVLANIPNSKKDELYARHRAAVNAIAEVEENEKEE